MALFGRRLLGATLRGARRRAVAAGLVLRYGVYYLLIAPSEVLGRALSYGPEGGVDSDHEGP